MFGLRHKPAKTRSLSSDSCKPDFSIRPSAFGSLEIWNVCMPGRYFLSNIVSIFFSINSSIKCMACLLCIKLFQMILLRLFSNK